MFNSGFADPNARPVTSRCVCPGQGWLLPWMLLTAVNGFVIPHSIAQDSSASPTHSVWADFVEPSFPFYSSVLDARHLGAGWPTNNLTPRGLILNLGHDAWACFDCDLLRMAAIWTGAGVTPDGMAPGSYHRAGVKAPEGQESLPHLIGTPWIANGIYPGWQTGERTRFIDPRESGPDEHEVGRGPLPAELGRFLAIRLMSQGVELEYAVGRATVRERVNAELVNDQLRIQRRFQLEGVQTPLWLLVGKRDLKAQPQLHINLVAAVEVRERLIQQESPDGLVEVRVTPGRNPIEFGISLAMTSPVAMRTNAPPVAETKSVRRWGAEVYTQGRLSTATDAYVVDAIPLPLANANRRNVRLADIAFFRDGRAAAVTFDGDVWLIGGLSGDLSQVRWQRFASGLHEPLSLCIRDDSVFVFDRNGIWRLRDTDGNGEADVHEMFANGFTQTAETREFANSMKLAPDGSFIIAKGGQQSTTLGRHNGSVLRVAPDGKSVTVLGHGLRQPFIGVDPHTGLVTASDQQGHYVPATPLYIIRDNQYFGFLTGLQPKEQFPAPIAEPLTWIPHPVNASGATQVWLSDARMGAVTDGLIHFGYNRPEIFLVRWNAHSTVPQAAVVSLTTDLAFAPLSGAVNPADGQLYLAGFQIWGSTAKPISGLARLRYTGATSMLPREVVPVDKGILLRFDLPLDGAAATNVANYSVERWNYRRTANYGSPHFKLDGSPGQEWLTPSSAYLSRDARCVLIAIPDLKPVMQMRLGWGVTTREGIGFTQNAFFTAKELVKFNAAAEGFAEVPIDLTPRSSSRAATPITVEEGRKLSVLMGCVACHAVDHTAGGRVGPTWKGLFGAQREFKDGEPAVADEAYLRESMLQPAAKVVLGFETNDAGMPSYAGVLDEAQIQALVLYIKTLH